MGNQIWILTPEEAYKKYGDMVYRLAFSRVQNKMDAEDITQEVFMKYIRYKGQFANEEHIKAWLLKVALNSSKSLFSSAWRRHYASLEEALSSGVQMEEKSEVYYTVMQLPEKYRVVIQLYYYQELSVAEISKIIGKKETTIRSQLKRARAKLQEMLKEGRYEF
ncbi:MAG: sigma-70 family RNA polymerase sigma factor [Lachnospira sp.]|nr:sigma-70 family RNA polymerase sigma factor [Lachnospira sp.]